ncbi:MAG: HAMP domain-containing histidine kinase, partial [Dehalococcoidia bacterium]|nr:HAMP domain-containing histidine kinase [Dehalococcoidia bacterium]
VFSIGVAALVARSLYRPVHRMTLAVAALAEGNYDQRVPEAGPTELRRLGAAFNDMAARVKLSQQRLRDFVADVSHELKSPLTSIGGFAQALLDGTAEDEATRTRAAEIIRDESRRVASQVDELLDLSRVQSGQVVMSFQDISVFELVGLCGELLGVRAKEMGVCLDLDVPLHLRIMGDADRLERVVNNLIDNALKHSPRGGRICIVAREVGQECVELAVSDEGPGIPGDNLDLVFDRFYQGTGVRTGAGLGLAIAREIMHAHGGAIRAENGLKKGAVFTMRLPTGHLPVTGEQPQ